MVFEKTTSIVPDSAFRAAIDISINLKRDDIFIASYYLTAAVAARAYEETERRDRFVLLQRSLYLKPGRYSGLVLASDKTSSREFRGELSFEAKDYTTPGFGNPVPVEHRTDDAAIRLFGFRASFPFAGPTIAAIPVSDGYDAEWHFKLFNEQSTIPLFDDVLQPSRRPRHVMLPAASGQVESFVMLPCTDCIGAWLLFELPLEKYDIGTYRMQILAKRGERIDSVNFTTEIFWRDMPYSMRNIDFALDAMRYILTKEQLSRMREGDAEQKRSAFRRYWKERDPTPEVEYNEMMTEYFRRVDKAYYMFQTLFERNGVNTDRGKVYILFGPPEDTQRILAADQPATEIWYYPSLDKTFRFVDRSKDGNLRLVEE